MDNTTGGNTPIDMTAHLNKKEIESVRKDITDVKKDLQLLSRAVNMLALTMGELTTPLKNTFEDIFDRLDKLEDM